MNDKQPECISRSPWGTKAGWKEAAIEPPLQRPDAVIAVAGSKSYTNRALIAAAMAEGPSTLRNILRSDDTYWCLDALQRLGVRAEVDGDAVAIIGTGGNWPVRSGRLYAGAAGTAARFLPGALAAGEAGQWTLEGNARLSERPIRPLVEALNGLGANIGYAGGEGGLPLEIYARGLKGGRVTISGSVSSQFLSGLLLAAPYAREATDITVEGGLVQPAYVAITIELMKRFGVHVDHSAAFDRFTVETQTYKGAELALEPDASTCGYALGYAALTGGRVRISNMSAATLQPDIGMLGLLGRMGCVVNKNGEGIELMGTGTLRGGFTVSMREMSDQTMTLAALAPFADAPITITEVAHIRAHECDRIRAVCETLTRLGIRTDEREDGLTVYPGNPRPALLDTYDDHRMAMAFALVGARAKGVRLRDPECVSKTCPAYFDMMRLLGLRVSFH